MSWTISPGQPAIAYSRTLAAFSPVRHGVTVLPAEGPAPDYSFSTNPDPPSVTSARRSACHRLGFGLEDLIVPAQVHGSRISVAAQGERGRGATSPVDALNGCDALISNTPGMLLAITVADCLPVFLVEPGSGSIGIAHSGWRGTAGRIAANMVKAMQESFGARPQECLAAIGPGIGSTYEVDEAVRTAFPEPERSCPGAFTKTRPGHWMLDLYAIVRWQLLNIGIPEEAIDIAPWRTDSDTSLFPSHRARAGCPRFAALLGLALS